MFQCFWCNKPLSKREKTKDHLLSSYIRKKFNSKSEVYDSCKRCNGLRSRIQSTYANIETGKATFEAVCRLLASLDLYFFRDKIADKVRNNFQKNLCLKEIDEIMAFQDNEGGRPLFSEAGSGRVLKLVAWVTHKPKQKHGKLLYKFKRRILAMDQLYFCEKDMTYILVRNDKVVEEIQCIK